MMIKFVEVGKKFNNGTNALSDVTFEIERGEFVFLIGPSGAGKTTIFRIIMKDILPTSGQVYVSDSDIGKISGKLARKLRKSIGIVFQDLKILHDRTVGENISLPLEVEELPTRIIREKLEEVINKVGLKNHEDLFPAQLSGGELQRVAIARALITNPEILLADEPTGNLDIANSWEILNLLEVINKNGTTIIMATHNADIVNSLKKRVIGLENGKIIKDDKNGKY